MLLMPHSDCVYYQIPPLDIQLQIALKPCSCESPHLLDLCNETVPPSTDHGCEHHRPRDAGSPDKENQKKKKKKPNKKKNDPYGGRGRGAAGRGGRGGRRGRRSGGRAGRGG